MIPLKDLKRVQMQGIAYLRELGAADSNPNPEFGICGHFAKKIGEDIMILFPAYDLIRNRWEHFSNSPSFPVPNPTPKKGFSSRINGAFAYDHLEKWTGKYGALRRKFARYLADEFEKMYMVPPLPDDLVVDK